MSGKSWGLGSITRSLTGTEWTPFYAVLAAPRTFQGNGASFQICLLGLAVFGCCGNAPDLFLIVWECLRHILDLTGPDRCLTRNLDRFLPPVLRLTGSSLWAGRKRGQRPTVGGGTRKPFSCLRGYLGMGPTLGTWVPEQQQSI